MDKLQQVQLKVQRRLSIDKVFSWRSANSRSKSVEKGGSRSPTSAAKSAAPRQRAPHPVPKGAENAPCPITGLFAVEEPTQSAEDAKAALDADADIMEEARALARRAVAPSPTPKAMPKLTAVVPLNVIDHKHMPNAATRQLVREAGGVQALRAFTTRFYERCFADPHIDKFIRSHEDAHGERFATWIAEKLGDGTAWSDELRTRPRTQLRIGRRVVDVSYDRSSAHFAAWHSPKREAHKFGEHFKLDDARVWMRLHFWAARETGMFERSPQFMDYYVRFIAHFVSIYSSKSPVFTRESMRWSADPQNVKRYLAAGNMMTDVIGQPLDEALKQLPAEERLYTGSGHLNSAWPYELTPLR